MPRRVLMICYHFPPQGSIGSLRALRFARHLPEFGWEPVVLAPRRTANPADPSLDVTALRILRAPTLEWSGVGTRLGGQPTAMHGARAGTTLGRLRAFARRWLYFPDAQIGWYPGAVRVARRLMREERIDALFSSAYPMSVHVIARRLQLDTRLPWVADFRDLWSEWSQEPPLRLERERGLERAVLAAAAGVTTVSATYGEHLRARGARRVEVITNGYDQEAPLPIGPLPARVVYLGTFYPSYQDHVVTALEALGRMHGRGRNLSLHFIGAAPAGLRGVIERCGLTDCTTASGHLPQAQAIAELREAGLLLVAGPAHARTPEVRGNIAAKSFEYLAARRPILMVGDPDSDLAGLLRPFARVAIVRPGDVDAAAEAVERLLCWKAGAEPPIDQFHARTAARRLAGLLDSL